MALHPCSSCHRHVRATAGTCPFCDVPLRVVRAPLPATLGLMLGLSVAAACGTDKGTGDESSMTQGDAANDEAGGSDTIGNDSANDEFDAGGETYGGAEWDTGETDEGPWDGDSTTTTGATTTTTATTTTDGDESESSTTAGQDSSTTDTPGETTTDAGGETYGGPDWDTGTSGGI